MKFTWEKGEWMEGKKVPGAWKDYPLEVVCFILMGGAVFFRFVIPWLVGGMKIWLTF